jgi:HTH-type transcriptional regulator/antitoxin HipB
VLTQKEFDRKFRSSLSKEEKTLDEVFESHFLVASLLLRARMLRGFSQAQVAKKANVRQSDISRYERGEKAPSLQTLSKLNRALGIEFTAKIKPSVKSTPQVKKVVAKRRTTQKQKF